MTSRSSKNVVFDYHIDHCLQYLLDSEEQDFKEQLRIGAYDEELTEQEKGRLLDFISGDQELVPVALLAKCNHVWAHATLASCVERDVPEETGPCPDCKVYGPNCKCEPEWGNCDR